MKTSKQIKGFFMVIGLGASLYATSASAFIHTDDGRRSGSPQFCLGEHSCTPYCAPEVRHGNMQAVDKALSSLAAGDLKDAEKFKALVQKAKGLSEEKRMGAYLDMVGIQNDTELVEFIGAREIPQKYVTNLAVNADLKDAQAKQVLSVLTKSLLGQEK